MFGDDDNDPFKDFDKNFQERWDENHKSFVQARRVHDVMSVVVPVLAGLVVLVAVVLCCYRCCRSRNRGRVLAPPTQPGGAPYPQQQYTVAVATYPVQGSGVPYAPAPYPTAQPAQAPYPTSMPAPAPYPAAQPAPAPYPGASPYPAPFPAPYPAPSAPHVDAQPPSYDQATSQMKSAPYNPNYPH